MKKHNGLTLVELLSVIVIIVLLISIFLPSLQNVKQQTNSVSCRYNLRNDTTFSPIELVLVSPDCISGRPTIVGRFLIWEHIPENPYLYGSHGLNLWICDNRRVSDTCRRQQYWILHTCIKQSEDNSKDL